MARGIALNIGLNAVDSEPLPATATASPWKGEPCSPARPTRAPWSTLATAHEASRSAGPLLSKQAPSSCHRPGRDHQAWPAKALAPGDIFFLTYSGHGGQVPEHSTPTTSRRRTSSTRPGASTTASSSTTSCSGCSAAFKPGVRIVVLSDSCHSGTVTRTAPATHARHDGTVDEGDVRPKQLPYGRSPSPRRRRTRPRSTTSCRRRCPRSAWRRSAATVVLLSGYSAPRVTPPPFSWPGPAATGPCAVFGLIEETCTPELLLDHREESLARALHERYLRQQQDAGARLGEKPALVPWAELGAEGRRESRAHARRSGGRSRRSGSRSFSSIGGTPLCSSSIPPRWSGWRARSTRGGPPRSSVPAGAWARATSPNGTRPHSVGAALPEGP